MKKFLGTLLCFIGGTAALILLTIILMGISEHNYSFLFSGIKLLLLIGALPFWIGYRIVSKESMEVNAFNEQTKTFFTNFFDEKNPQLIDGFNNKELVGGAAVVLIGGIVLLSLIGFQYYWVLLIILALRFYSYTKNKIPPCPVCKSKKVSYETKSSYHSCMGCVLAIIFLPLALFAFSRYRKYTCDECGHKWE